MSVPDREPANGLQHREPQVYQDSVETREPQVKRKRQPKECQMTGSTPRGKSALATMSPDEKKKLAQKALSRVNSGALDGNYSTYIPKNELVCLKEYIEQLKARAAAVDGGHGAQELRSQLAQSLYCVSSLEKKLETAEQIIRNAQANALKAFHELSVVEQNSVVAEADASMKAQVESAMSSIQQQCDVFEAQMAQSKLEMDKQASALAQERALNAELKAALDVARLAPPCQPVTWSDVKFDAPLSRTTDFVFLPNVPSEKVSENDVRNQLAEKNFYETFLADCHRSLKDKLSDVFCLAQFSRRQDGPPVNTVTVLAFNTLRHMNREQTNKLLKNSLMHTTVDASASVHIDAIMTLL